MISPVHDIAPYDFKDPELKRMAFEQYKLLVESLNKINETRENSNNFWIGVNGLGASSLAYLRDTQTIAQDHKCFLLWTLLALGVFLSLSWLSYLKAIKNALTIRSELLVEIEKAFPLPLFSKVFYLAQEKPQKPLLTHREMLVPYLFLGGYLFFAILLFFFPKEVVKVALI